MKTRHLLPMTMLALAVVAGCSSVPLNNANLDAAHNDYRVAQNNPQTRDGAPVEMKQAADALALADASLARRDRMAEVDHLAYLAKSRVALAQEVGRQKAAEVAVTEANAARDKARLAARTDEADAAQRNAASSQRQADASQAQSEASQRQAANARQQTAAAQQQAAMSQQQTNDANVRAMQLEEQLKEMNAKKTDRGMVVTMGDVLFDTNRAELKSGGLRNVEKLGGFLKQYPQRKALIEGFTDSTGSDGTNQALSGRRADAVRTALVGMGVGSERLATHAYGEAYPIAGNDSADGRQLNRRVEIVLSDDSGNILPR